MKVYFYTDSEVSFLHDKEYIIYQDNFEDVFKELDKIIMYRGEISHMFMNYFLTVLYTIYKFRPIYGVNYYKYLCTSCSKEELPKILWDVCKTSRFLPFIFERKILNIIEKHKEDKSKKDKDIFIKVVFDPSVHHIMSKYGIIVSKKEALSMMGEKQEEKPSVFVEEKPQEKTQDVIEEKPQVFVEEKHEIKSNKKKK